MINAFDPRYMATHEPDFMKSFRTHEANRQAAATLAKYVEKKRKTDPTYGYIHGVTKIPLEMREFHVYSKAGMPKTRSQMMSEIVAKKKKTNKNYGTALPNSENIPK